MVDVDLFSPAPDSEGRDRVRRGHHVLHRAAQLQSVRDRRIGRGRRQRQREAVRVRRRGAVSCSLGAGEEHHLLRR